MGLVLTVDTGEGVQIVTPDGVVLTVRIERKKHAKINPNGSISARCKLWVDAPREFDIRRIGVDYKSTPTSTRRYKCSDG